MKSVVFVSLICISLLFTIIDSAHSQNLLAKEIIEKADKLMQGETNQGQMIMKIVRPTWERTITMKNWTKGREYSLVYILSPAKEKGQTFLKRQNEMWNWNPTISRMIKLPPSMMSQGWMGSDFTNDDLLKESSIVVDYDHKIESEETLDGYVCHKIVMTPKPEAAVVWGKMIKWIDKEHFFQLKTEYYDEDGYLVKTEIAKDIKKMDDREIPTYFEIVPADEEGNKTILIMDDVKFNKPLKDGFFSQQNMKRVR